MSSFLAESKKAFRVIFLPATFGNLAPFNMRVVEFYLNKKLIYSDREMRWVIESLEFFFAKNEKSDVGEILFLFLST